MKRIFIMLAVILIGISVTAQQTKEDYLQKSKNQKTAGWIFTAGGGAMVIAGLVLISSDPSYFSGETVGALLAVGGGAAVTTGILLFNASNRNKKKAEGLAMTLDLKLEKAVLLENLTLQNNYYPALSVKLELK